jgi:hypothetical protein
MASEGSSSKRFAFVTAFPRWSDAKSRIHADLHSEGHRGPRRAEQGLACGRHEPPPGGVLYTRTTGSGQPGSGSIASPPGEPIVLITGCVVRMGRTVISLLPRFLSAIERGRF